MLLTTIIMVSGVAAIHSKSQIQEMIGAKITWEEYGKFTLRLALNPILSILYHPWRALIFGQDTPAKVQTPPPDAGEGT